MPRDKLAAAQQAGEVLAAHRILTDAYRTDVRPLLSQIRTEVGTPTDPIAAYWASSYEEKFQNKRGLATPSGGFQ